MADIQQYSVSIKFKTEGSEATEEKVKKLQEQVDKLKGSGKGFDLGSIINVSKLGTVASKVGGVLKTVVTSIFSERTGRAIGNATKSMADYIETVNLFRTSLGAAGDEAMKFVDRAESELGLDPEQLMHSISSFYNLADGLGIANDRAYLMAQNLTQLTGDLSSFANISQKAAEQKLMSGFSGQVKPLREYGIALDQASLQELAYSLGIEQRVKTMTRAQKTELIYYQIMKSTQKMQGDLSRTLLSPANSLRVLQTEFKQLTRAVGSIFIPGMMRIVPVVRAITKALTEAAKSIASFFGFEITDYYADLSDVGTLLDGVADDIGDVGDEAEGTAKKLNKMLMPFDELNNITSGSGSGSGSGAGGVGFGGSLGIDLPTYDMFQGDGLADLIKNGDWITAIQEISGKINQAMSEIPWTEIQRNVKTGAENVAKALNTGITSIDWTLVGSTLGQGLNTVLGGVSTFVATFDFKATGKAIADTISGFFDTVNWDDIGKTLSNGFVGALDLMVSGADNFDSGKVYDAIFKVVTNIDWNTLGTKLFEHIKKGLGYSPVALIVKGWMKIVEGGINWILEKIGGIKITIPNWMKKLVGLPEDAVISFGIGKVDFKVDETIDNIIDTAFDVAGAKGKILATGFGVAIGTNFASGVSDGIYESDLSKITPDTIQDALDQSDKAKSWAKSTIEEYGKGIDSQNNPITRALGTINTLLKGNLDQSNNSGSWGSSTVQEYQKGIENKTDPASKALEKINSLISGNLDESDNSAAWGSSTIQEYQKGIEMQNDPISRALGKVNSLISGNLDESDNSNSWGSSTVEEYVKGIDSQNNPVTRALGTINTLLKGNLDQSNNSSNWGSSTVNEYNKGITNKKGDTKTSVNQITGTVSQLNQSNNSNGWGSSTILQYINGINSQKNPVSNAMATLNKLIGGGLGVNNSYSWGQDMVQGMINGIKSMKQRWEDTGTWIGKMIASYIHFSRPDKGPLRDYEKWMPDMVIGLTNSLLQAMPKLNATMMKVSTDLMKSFTQTGLPEVANPFADGNINSSVVGEIVNKTSASNKDSSMSNMATATYSAISRALSENKANGSQKIIVNVGNKTVYEGYGTYRDEQSKMLGVNT